MIEKLPFTEIHTGGEDMVDLVEFRPVAPYEMQHKINELCDVVNEQQKQIDKMSCAILDLATPNGENKALESIKAEPKTPTENVPEPIKLYVCGDGSVHDNLDVAKSHAASIFNPLPAGATTTDSIYLEQELIRTRKALDVAQSAFVKLANNAYDMDEHIYIDKILNQIETLTKGGEI